VEQNQSGWGLYLATLGVELFPALVRYILVLVISFIVRIAITIILFPLALLGVVSGYFTLIASDEYARFQYTLEQIGLFCAIMFALYPIILSLIARFAPESGFFATRLTLDAQDPSPREARLLRESCDILEQTAPGITFPHAYYVIEYQIPMAFSLGTTLYITRPLFSTPFLLPVLTKELGHINSSDAKLNLALRSLTISFLQLAPGLAGRSMTTAFLSALRGHSTSALVVGGVGALAGLGALGRGGIGLGFRKILWTQYWQERTYQADRFAANRGQGLGLLEYLKKYRTSNITVPFFVVAEPPSEYRISRLQRYLDDGDASPVSATMQVLQPIPPLTSTDEDQSAIPQLGIPAKEARRLGLRQLGQAALIVAGLFIVWQAFIMSSSSPLGHWILVNQCIAAGCIPKPTFGPPRHERLTLSITSPGSQQHSMIWMVKRPGDIGEPKDVIAQVSCKYTQLGSTIRLTLLGGQPTDTRITIPFDFTVERKNDHELILRSQFFAYRFRNVDEYDKQRNTLLGHWRNNVNEEIVTFVTDYDAVTFGDKPGFYTLVDESHILITMDGTNDNQLFQYNIDGTTLALVDPRTGEAKYVREK
jgi:Zn-dependent protease with chaperone function